MKIHVVQKGDTLWNIAEQYNVSYEDLLQMNAHISSPDMIMPGMKIRVPSESKNVKTEHVKDNYPKTQEPYHAMPQKAKPIIEEDDDKESKPIKTETPWQSTMPKPNLDMQGMQKPYDYPELTQSEKPDDSKPYPDNDYQVPPMQATPPPMGQQPNDYQPWAMPEKVCKCCGQPIYNINYQGMMPHHFMTQMPPAPMAMPIQHEMGCTAQPNQGMAGMPEWGGHHMAEPGCESGPMPHMNTQYAPDPGYSQMPQQQPFMGTQTPGWQMPNQGFQPMQPMQSQSMNMPPAYPHAPSQGDMPNAPYPAPPYQQREHEQSDEDNLNSES